MKYITTEILGRPFRGYIPDGSGVWYRDKVCTRMMAAATTTIWFCIPAFCIYRIAATRLLKVIQVRRRQRRLTCHQISNRVSATSDPAASGNQLQTIIRP